MSDNATTVVHGDGVAERVFAHTRVWRLTPDVFAAAAGLIAEHEPAPDVGIARPDTGGTCCQILPRHAGAPSGKHVHRVPPTRPRLARHAAPRLYGQAHRAYVGRAQVRKERACRSTPVPPTTGRRTPR